MKKIVYQLTDKGYISETHVANLNIDGTVIDEDKKNFIAIDPSNNLYKPKWIGNKWIEGATQEEIDELTKVEPSPPTQAEILEQRLADLEIMLAEILFN